MSTGCPQKNFILLWKAIVPLKIVVGIKVGGFSESAEADLSVEYQNFPVALQGAEIFEFKVDPVPNLTFFNVMSGVESNTFFDFKKGIALLKIIITPLGANQRQCECLSGCSGLLSCEQCYSKPYNSFIPFFHIISIVKVSVANVEDAHHSTH